ncbi:MAG: DUF4329 domain-containing protein [Gammaproteobacteria bacterium]|nr:DUF4329 domain-containing protein [Gammaproteobacteria bacterium]
MTNRKFTFAALITACLFSTATTVNAGLFASNELDTASNRGLKFSRSFVATDHQIGFRASDFTYLEVAPSRDLEFLEGTEPYRSMRFDFTQSLDDRLLHFSSTTAEQEQQFRLGTSIGDITYSLHAGRGHSFVRSENAFQGTNPYFFHGGVDLDYRYSGIDLRHALSNSIDTQIGAVRLTSTNVEDRFGYFTGLSSDRFYSRFSLYERGNDKVGRGLESGMVWGSVKIEYQELKTTNDASLRRLSLLVNGNKNRKVRLDLESGRNPLYENGDENRLMLSFSGQIGNAKTPFYATETETEASEEETKKKRHTGFIIGGVAVAGVIAASGSSSSGDGDNDNAQRFPTQNAAGRNVLNGINPTSVRQNREHGGWVYRRSDGSFSSTEPVAGTVASVNLGNPQTTVPSGTRATASYHTHGGPDPRYLNEQFSPQDLLSDNLFGVDGYLGTPAGRLLFHNHRTNAVIQLGRIAN